MMLFAVTIAVTIVYLDEEFVYDAEATCVGFDFCLRLTGYRTLRYHRVHPLYHLVILNAPWVFIACRMLLFSAHASSCSLDVWFKLQVMIAPQEEALLCFV